MKEEVKKELDYWIKKYNWTRTEQIDWQYLSQYRKVSEDFIREFKNQVDWFYISWCQELSEDFIREVQDKVDWENVFVNVHIELSKNFIIEFKDKLDLKLMLNYDKITQAFYNKLKKPKSRHELLDFL